MGNCSELEKAYMFGDGELPPEGAAAAIAHAASCPDCAAAMETHGRVKTYFSLLRKAARPVGLEASVKYALRAAAEEDIGMLWRAMVPAGALAFATLGCWLLLDSWTDQQPLSDMIVDRGSAIYEVIGGPDDLLRQLKLEGQDL